jgi:hypothetical protein
MLQSHILLLKVEAALQTAGKAAISTYLSERRNKK